MQAHENEEENGPLVMASDVLKVVSWHITSLQKAFENGLLDFIKVHSPDIICLQAQPEEGNSANASNQEKKQYMEIGKANDKYLIEGYKGYIIANSEPNNIKDAETIMFTKIKPIKVSRTDLDEEEEKASQASNGKNDSSIMTIEFTNFFIVNAIAPGQTENEDIVTKWFEKLQKLLNDLDSQKTTILCGDFKVAHQALDINASNSNEFKYYEDSKNQKRFSDFLSDAYADIFRKLHPDKQQFSYFASSSGKPGENKSKCRTDYFIAPNESIETKIVVDCSIANIDGLKHSPVVLLLDREKLISTVHDLLVNSLPSDERRNEIFYPFGNIPNDNKDESKNESSTNQEITPNETINTNNSGTTKNSEKKVDNDSTVANGEDIIEYEDEDEYNDEVDEYESSEENEEEEIQLAPGHKIKTRRSKGRFFDFSRQAVRGKRGKNKSTKKDDDDYAPIKRPTVHSKQKAKAKNNTNSSSEPHRGRGRPPKKAKPENN